MLSLCNTIIAEENVENLTEGKLSCFSHLLRMSAPLCHFELRIGKFRRQRGNFVVYTPTHPHPHPLGEQRNPRRSWHCRSNGRLYKCVRSMCGPFRWVTTILFFLTSRINSLCNCYHILFKLFSGN